MMKILAKNEKHRIMMKILAKNKEKPRIRMNILPRT